VFDRLASVVVLVVQIPAHGRTAAAGMTGGVGG
jgi:hypothetical protein